MKPAVSNGRNYDKDQRIFFNLRSQFPNVPIQLMLIPLMILSNLIMGRSPCFKKKLIKHRNVLKHRGTIDIPFPRFLR